MLRSTPSAHAIRAAARRGVVVFVLPLVLASGCLPYTVGSTAATVAPNTTTRSSTYYFIPNAIKVDGDSIGAPMSGHEREWRFGMSDRSDAGLRVLWGGAVVNYKQRVADAAPGRPALAYMVGGGVVNWGEHLHGEATLVASGDPQATVSPYGGLRAMQVVPITAGAVHDSPTLGLFAGLQLGRGAMVLRPEIGVYYDRSALDLRSRNIIVVPAISMQRRRREEAEVRSVPTRAGEGRAAARPGTPSREMGGRIRCTLLCAAVPGPWRGTRPLP